ncbi:MAG: CRISPR-associated helicase Cas3', partial [Ktedonobacterales bacterium]
IDQLLSSFIGSPYALGSAQANLNVGAVVGSYLVLDEFHLYPLEKGAGARKTTLAMLQLLKGLSPFVLMTATFSSRLLDELGALLDAEVVRVTDDHELAEIMGDRTRTMQVSPAALSAEGILSAHAAARARGAGASLVVCNTVAQAQTIYTQLRDTLAAREETDGTRLQLLHSRFTQVDRQAKRESLEQWLGKDAWRDGRYLGPSTIVVATQVVEVGLNISVGALHTELAPANSIIQRAGRCARFAGQRGDVIVYHPLAPSAAGAEGSTEGRQSLADYGAQTDDTREAQRKAKAAYLPYERETCEATWRELARRAGATGGTPLPFGFADEQALIDVVHTDADAAMIADFTGS